MAKKEQVNAFNLKVHLVKGRLGSIIKLIPVHHFNLDLFLLFVCFSFQAWVYYTY